VKVPKTKKTADKARILVVDDAPDTREVLERNLSLAGYRVATAGSVAEALRALDAATFDLVITDLKLPQESGLDLIRFVRENLKDTEVMMITGYATIEGAVEAVKLGADEYLSKPFTDEEIAAAVKRALDKLAMRKLASVDWERPAQTGNFGIIGESQAIKEVLSAIAKAAKTNATVLIAGESGTGKELVARAIHYSSDRASAPFVPVNCGAIPHELMESELFGYMKGSFTGASETRAGFFQTADGGSIFLDEISETTPSMQVKLLRILQDKEIYMVGSRRPQKVDVRILAATNKDLTNLVRNKAFRDDLYYRLNVVNIFIPPLRERDEDVLILTKHFAAKFARELGKNTPQFSDSVLKSLVSYSWPGNVRELENVIQRLVVMSESDTIDVPELPPLMRFSIPGSSRPNKSLAEMEAEYVQQVLISVNGNKSRAAEILKIDRKTLREKLKEFIPEE
jgi:two-component system, NtrC family, response regulator HydG